MIPLRVFGILANVVLIVTAILIHNFLVMGVQMVMLVVNPIGCTRRWSWGAT